MTIEKILQEKRKGRDGSLDERIGREEERQKAGERQGNSRPYFLGHSDRKQNVYYIKSKDIK